MIDKKDIPMGTAPKAASVAAAGTLLSGWMDAAAYRAVHALVTQGAGGGTAALTFHQATDATGTGVKALSAWSGGTLATDRIEVTNHPDLLDTNNGFRFVRATVTVTGGTGTVIGLVLLGLEPRYA